jgi:hypothetical protein
MARLERGSGSVGQCGHLCLIQARSRSLFSYFDADHLVRWWRAWFQLRDDADTPLPAFTGSRPVSHPNWQYGVDQMDLPRLQPLVETVQGLLQRALIGMEILWTIFSRSVQPLRR